MNQAFGYRNTSEGSNSVDDIRYRMMSSPTGRQLARDGSFVREIVTFDPADPSANLTQVWPNGSSVLYDRAGTLESWSYTRATGWQLA